MSDLKNANQLAREGKINDAILIYKKIAAENPKLKSIANFNIQYLQSKGDRDLEYAKSSISSELEKRIEGSNSQSDSVDKIPNGNFYSIAEDSWNKWKLEFGPGIVEFLGATSVKISAEKSNRYYLSKVFKFKKNCRYRLKFSISNVAGEGGGHFFYILNSTGITGTKELLLSDLKIEAINQLYFDVSNDCELTLRIGLGTTASINETTSIVVSDFNIDEVPIPQNNAHLLNEFSKEFIDPELILPPIVGAGNDYSAIEFRAQDLISQNTKWESKKVSIVIPVFDRANLLRNTLACLVHQTYPKDLIEIILVDDGSEKEDIEKVFSEFTAHLNIYYARQKRNGYGLSRARNLGARLATGEVLFFLDSDILLPNRFIRHMMAYHHLSSKCTILGIRDFIDATNLKHQDLFSQKIAPDQIGKARSSNPHFKEFVNADGHTFDWRLNDFEKNDWLKGSSNPFRYFGGGHASVSRNTFLRIGGYDEDFSEWGNEDQEFAYRLWIDGTYFIPLKDVLDFHQEETETPHQIHKLEENTATKLLLESKVPHLSVRSYEKSRKYSTPLFSIYIPAHNVEKYINDCVDSALSQTILDFEIIIVDDGSTDQTSKLLEKYANNPRVRLFRKINSGIGSTSNYAIDNARGLYIVQLESDDMLQPNALEKLKQFYSDNPQAECVYTMYETVNASGLKVGDGWSPSKFDRYENLIGMSVPHLRSFRRTLLGRGLRFDETLINAVDYDFYLKVSQLCEIYFLNECLYKYRIHSSQTSSIEDFDQKQNHVNVVNLFLQSIGSNDFYAKNLNPFSPRRNYILKRGSDFESKILNYKFKQPEMPTLELPAPTMAGNDYSPIQEFVESYYRTHEKKYDQFISIVVPVYNRAERLSRCLAGICQQSYPRDLIEVIVVDDGSSDDVLKVIDKYSKLLDLKYAKQADVGYRLSAARNLGIRTASYENISIIDCDLIPLPFFIESFMQYLHHFDNVVLLGHQRFVDPTGISDDQILKNVKTLEKFKDIRSENSTMEEGNDGITKDWRYKLYEETNYLKNDEFPYRAFSSGHVAYKKKVIQDADFYDEDFNVWGCEDNETGYRIYRKGYYFVPVLAAVDLHQEPPSGKNETNREADRLISRQLLQAKVPATRGWFGEAYQLKDGDAPLVSVCIPVHNTGHFAKLAVDSALNQTLKSLEVVIYDDASNDGTLEMLQAEYSKNSRVRIITNKQHHNVTYARNELINAAKGEFIGFLDSDDLLKPNCLEECIKAFRGHAEIGIVSTNYERINEDGSLIGDGWQPANYTRQGLLYGNIFTHFRIFRVRDWFRSRKWTPEEIKQYGYGEDWDLCIKLAEVTEFSRINQSLYQYRVRGSSITNQSDIRFKGSQTLTVINANLKKMGLPSAVLLDPENNPHSIGYAQ